MGGATSIQETKFLKLLAIESKAVAILPKVRWWARFHLPSLLVLGRKRDGKDKLLNLCSEKGVCGFYRCL